MADSCSNFSFAAVEGEVSIKTPTYSGNLLFSSLVKESIFCGARSSSTIKSFAVKPETNWPFLSVTVIGSRTRRIFTTSASGEGSGVAAGAGFFCGVDAGFCAAAENATKDSPVRTNNKQNDDLFMAYSGNPDLR